MALLKDTHISERKVPTASQFFNIFNHTQFVIPGGLSSSTGNINSGTFGYVTNARDPRIGQVALKFLF